MPCAQLQNFIHSTCHTTPKFPLKILNSNVDTNKKFFGYIQIFVKPWCIPPESGDFQVARLYGKDGLNRKSCKNFIGSGSVLKSGKFWADFAPQYEYMF